MRELFWVEKNQTLVIFSTRTPAGMLFEIPQDLPPFLVTRNLRLHSMYLCVGRRFGYLIAAVMFIHTRISPSLHHLDFVGKGRAGKGREGNGRGRKGREENGGICWLLMVRATLVPGWIRGLFDATESMNKSIAFLGGTEMADPGF